MASYSYFKTLSAPAISAPFTSGRTAWISLMAKGLSDAKSRASMISLSDFAMIVVLVFFKMRLQENIGIQVGLHDPHESHLHQFQDGQKGDHKLGDRSVLVKELDKKERSLCLESIHDLRGFVFERPLLPLEADRGARQPFLHNPLEGIDE